MLLRNPPGSEAILDNLGERGALRSKSGRDSGIMRVNSLKIGVNGLNTE